MQRVLNAPHLAESIHIMQSANHSRTRNERVQALKNFERMHSAGNRGVTR
jgi:hypothetical protein